MLLLFDVMPYTLPLRGFIAQRPATERSEVERHVSPHATPRIERIVVAPVGVNSHPSTLQLRKRVPQNTAWKDVFFDLWRSNR